MILDRMTEYETSRYTNLYLLSEIPELMIDISPSQQFERVKCGLADRENVGLLLNMNDMRTAFASAHARPSAKPGDKTLKGKSQTTAKSGSPPTVGSGFAHRQFRLNKSSDSLATYDEISEFSDIEGGGAAGIDVVSQIFHSAFGQAGLDMGLTSVPRDPADAAMLWVKSIHRVRNAITDLRLTSQGIETYSMGKSLCFFSECLHASMDRRSSLVKSCSSKALRDATEQGYFAKNSIGVVEEVQTNLKEVALTLARKANTSDADNQSPTASRRSRLQRASSGAVEGAKQIVYSFFSIVLFYGDCRWGLYVLCLSLQYEPLCLTRREKKNH